MSREQEQDRAVFLDGIRGWASLMVLLSHLLVFTLPGASPAYSGWYIAFPSDGNLAVFVFFVLSGFALTIGYLQTGRLQVISSLALRRYLRLAIPVLASSLLALTMLKAGLFDNARAGDATHNAWLSGFYAFPADFVACLKFALYDVFFAYTGHDTYNPVLWTMSIEFFGSFFVFSLAAIALGAKKRVHILLAVLAYLAFTRNIYYLPFLLGLLIALHYRIPGQSPLLRRIAPLALLLAAYYSSSSLRGGLAGLPAIPRSDFLTLSAAGLIVFFASLDSPVRAFFENRFSRYLGSISFPLYLTHFLVICSFTSLLMVEIPKHGLGPVASGHVNLVATLLVCFAVAHGFRRVESFSIAAARRFSDALMK